ncbi:ArsR/SmtB family transcription factor [Paenibacillus mendelii]|uniref:ArsR/SmtB family transcription factor n=1 Tax=Paenibacillus mendelii TaxID=206163 RepID=A0ABV6JK80_9BACL|nr:metalloregulator ArsR/SmtB family transcription factor [Paenibacillus mendelii]MCQ6559896.1 metalloregulator ArsR/SmtB family transcription factor [Paenibacillus mendelii]
MNIDQLFTAMAEPNRRRMLELLRSGGKSAGELSSVFDISNSAVSQHLKILSNSGLVAVEKRKTSRIYYLRKEGFQDLQQYLNQFWYDHLLVLKQLAEEEERENQTHE